MRRKLSIFFFEIISITLLSHNITVIIFIATFNITMITINHHHHRGHRLQRCNSSLHCLLFQDIDECNNGSHSCDVNANCENTNGSHNICKEGYIGDGKSCQGIQKYFQRQRRNSQPWSLYLDHHFAHLIVNCVAPLHYNNSYEKHIQQLFILTNSHNCTGKEG